jgi:PAS domain-containing protein
VRAESLHVQLNTALQRLAVLQRRAENLSSKTPGLLHQTLSELETAIEQLQTAQQELVSQREDISSLRSRLEQERRRYWQFFDAAPDAYLVTSPDADILETNRAAAELLNISQRFLVGKNFSVFVCTDRARVMAQARRLAEAGGGADWVFSVRPRERAPFEVACCVSASGAGDRTLRWLIRRIVATTA